MTSANIITLSSSPPNQIRTYDIASASLFPFPSERFHKKTPVLLPGNRALSTPQNASAPFTTASSILRKVSSNDDTPAIDLTQTCKTTSDEKNPTASDVTKFSVIKVPEEMAIIGAAGSHEVGDVPRKTFATQVKTVAGVVGEKKPRKSRARKSEVEIDEEGNIIQKPPTKPRSNKDTVNRDEDTGAPAKPLIKSRNKRVEARNDGDGKIKQKAIRKPRAKKTNDEVAAFIPKPRAKKANGNSQSKLPRAKVKKSTIDSDFDKRSAKARISGSTSKHFSIINDPFEDGSNHSLIPAVKRRTAWTPPSASANSEPAGVSTVIGNLEVGNASSDVSKRNERIRGFPDLLASFGFTGAQAPATQISIGVAGIKKRKLIELVRTGSSTPTGREATPALKEKAQKKKARTLTDLATSIYTPEDEVSEKAAPILQYFSIQANDGIAGDNTRVPKSRSKSPVKKTGLRAAQAPVLLSPESALRQVDNQDFVFGTSSQLAREESPTFLRDIHAAMQASNEIDEQGPLSNSAFVSRPLHTKSINGKSTPSAKHNLWSASSRDTFGELMIVETVDLTESPAITKKVETSIVKEHAFPAAVESNDEPLHDPDTLVTSGRPSQSLSKSIGPIEAAIRTELLSSPNESTGCSARLIKTSQKSKQSVSPRKSAKVPTKPSVSNKTLSEAMPNFSGYTTAQLTREIASYRFKPVKGRDQMISLLKRCWEGKQRLALATLGANTIVKSPLHKEQESIKDMSFSSSQAESSSPKRVRSRSRLDRTDLSPQKPKIRSGKESAHTIETLGLDSNTPLSQLRTPRKPKKKDEEAFDEISDSDANMTPSPPRRHPSEIRTPPRPLQIQCSTLAEESTDASINTSQVQLHKYMSRAVSNAPLSNDPMNPTWHEKILLYDPIILEDLTVWLNTGGLEKVGWDGEVEPKEVKKWCESKSICCLWKENLRGGARSRY